MGIDGLPQRAEGNLYVAVASLRSFLIPVPRGASLWESGKGFELVDEAETKDGSRQPSHALPGYALGRDGCSSRLESSVYHLRLYEGGGPSLD